MYKSTFFMHLTQNSIHNSTQPTTPKFLHVHHEFQCIISSKSYNNTNFGFNSPNLKVWLKLGRKVEFLGLPMTCHRPPLSSALYTPKTSPHSLNFVLLSIAVYHKCQNPSLYLNLGFYRCLYAKTLPFT